MKKIILLFTLIMLCGCTIDYNIEFESNGYVHDNMYIEELVDRFEETQPEDWNEIYYPRKHSMNIRNEFFEEKAVYEIKLEQDYSTFDKYFQDEFFIKYIGNYEYKEDSVCTSSIILNEGIKKYIYGDELAPYIDKINIKAYFPVDVIDTNATSVEGDAYIWELSETNKLDSLYITYKNPKVSESKNEKAFDYFIVFIVILLGVFIYIIVSKNKKSNAL